MRSSKSIFLAALFLSPMQSQASLAQSSPRLSAADASDLIAALNEAGQTRNAAESLRLLRELAESGQLQDVPPYMTAAAIWVIRQELEAEFLGLSYTLATSDRFSSMDADARAWFVAPALLHAARHGRDEDAAERLLLHLTSPVTFISLLRDRDYAPLWPLIERHAGESLVNATSRYVEWAEQRLADQPDNAGRFSEVLRSLYYAGRFADVVAQADRWHGAHAEAAAADEDVAWARNIEAYALDALGRVEEADRIFDRLSQLSPNRHPWMGNFLINRASRLVGQQRWTEGLAGADQARRVTRNSGTVYAKILIARDRTCALYGLNRAKDAAQDLRYLRENFDHGRLEATTGLLCAGLEAEAHSKIAAAFASGKSVFLDALLEPQFQLFYPPSRLPGVGEFILSQSELREAALKHVRLIPERFIPVSYHRRQDRVSAHMPDGHS